MFKDNDVICFLGDSITANCMHEAEIFQVLKAKYPHLKCFVSGVPGDVTANVGSRLYGSCLCYNPDYVVLMLGMNDFGLWLYPKAYKEDGLQEHKDSLFNSFKVNYENLAKEITAYGAQIIFCAPTAYDCVRVHEGEPEYVQSADPHVISNTYNDVLVKSGEFAKELSVKYNGYFVDYNSPMYKMLNDDRIVVGDDRVHPTDFGHHIMAQEFLYQLGEIDAPDYDTPFTFEEWNRKRYEIDVKLNNLLNFVEYCIFGDHTEESRLPIEEKLKLLKKRYDESENKLSYECICYKQYFEEFDKIREYRNDLVRLTMGKGE